MARYLYRPPFPPAMVYPPPTPDPHTCLEMKLLAALVLAIPFVLAAPVPDAEGDVTVAPTSGAPVDDAALSVVTSEDGSKPIDAVAKKGVFYAGDKVYPSKEALTEALKKKGAQPQDGQYPYYDYYAGYPAGYPPGYPPVAYDYGGYPYYAQDPYAADYATYYKAQKEQADYEQALKEYEYKKYLYDTDQMHLRPDLFPELAPKQQEIEQQIVQPEKPEPVARLPQKPLNQYKAPKPVIHEQAPYKYQLGEDDDDDEPAQIEPVNYHRPEHTYASNFNSAPPTVDDRKFQAPPQRLEQPERELRPKKQAPRPRFEDLPENRSSQFIKQNEDSEASYFPPESAYYPKAADRVIPVPPTHPAKIERTDVYPDTNTKPRFRPSPNVSVAANAAKEPDVPAIRESLSRERDPRIAPPPVVPTQVQNQSQRPSLNQYQRPKPEVFNNHNFNPAALPPSPPAPVPYQHNQQFRPSNAAPEERISQAQVYPRENAGFKGPSGGAGVNPMLAAAEEKAGGAAGGAGNANANFVIFNRDTLGKRILGKHGYLEETGADWVVPVAEY